MKKELQKEYGHYVKINKDNHGKAAIKAGEAVMKLLDEGKSCEEAEKGLNGLGLSGHMAGATISAVVKFHERGEEMKKWWNKFNGGTGEEKETINPALMTILSK